jgi:hypothetical protein
MATTSNTSETNKPDTDTSSAETGNAESNGATEQRELRTVTIDLPFVTATFHRPGISLPRVRIPNRQEMLFAAHTVQSYLPPPQQALYYGGLAALAAFEIIEWPVALAIGAGTALVRRLEPQQPQGRSWTKPSTTATKQPTTSVEGTDSAQASESSSEGSAGMPPSS